MRADQQTHWGRPCQHPDNATNPAGLTSKPMTHATGGTGTRYWDPANPKAVQIMYEVGDPNATDLVHQGPYLKYQYGKLELRVPLDGNPNPESGFSGDAPTRIAEWGGGRGASSDGGGGGDEIAAP